VHQRDLKHQRDLSKETFAVHQRDLKHQRDLSKETFAVHQRDLCAGMAWSL
jgi:hypothetical protein